MVYPSTLVEPVPGQRTSESAAVFLRVRTFQAPTRTVRLKFTLAPPGKGRSDTLAPRAPEVTAPPGGLPSGGPSFFCLPRCLRAAAAEELPPRGWSMVVIGMGRMGGFNVHLLER